MNAEQLVPVRLEPTLREDWNVPVALWREIDSLRARFFHNSSS
jgi:hypothetical protein